MTSVRQNKNLAYEIGLFRVALTVDRVHRAMQKHQSFAKLFYGSEQWGDRRARLTYFWWVVLGGNTLRTIDLEALPQDLRSGVNEQLLNDWLGLFRNAALPILGRELTRAWMQRAEEVARKYLINTEHETTPLAMAG